ncbi:MAG TPA: AraC family transcriptional regulator, partial [Chitinophagaceae bacterium]|nr:AraC family transcriptional regulator [Chitinophagaceae bacterium]
MINIHDTVKSHPEAFRQLRCGETLMTFFQCQVENKYQDAWSEYNYFVYVVEGREVWHTPRNAYDLHAGRCVFVRRGACIAEQFFETTTCFMFFFMPDEFICQALQSKVKPVARGSKEFDTIIPVDNNAFVQGFFQSMMPYFNEDREPDKALLELKFRELVLTLADTVGPSELQAYFCTLLQQPQAVTLQQVMEDNFCYNLKLEEYARLSRRSLSAFKRDFTDRYGTSPGKWLLEKRLHHARHLLTHRGRTVS